MVTASWWLAPGASPYVDETRTTDPSPSITDDAPASRNLHRFGPRIRTGKTNKFYWRPILCLSRPHFKNGVFSNVFFQSFCLLLLQHFIIRQMTTERSWAVTLGLIYRACRDTSVLIPSVFTAAGRDAALYQTGGRLPGMESYFDAMRKGPFISRYAHRDGSTTLHAWDGRHYANPAGRTVKRLSPSIPAIPTAYPEEIPGCLGVPPRR